jgi:DnaJ-domain-containing protein 1
MEGQFHVDRCHRITTQESYDGPPALGSNQPVPAWQFVIEIEGLLGAGSEPDPLFFVESWSLGVTASVESFQQRRQGQADRKRYGHKFDNFNHPRGQSFVQQRELYAEFHSSAPCRHDLRVHGAGSTPKSQEGPAASIQDPAPRGWETSAEEYASSGDTTRPMTQARACELLGVAATSARGQIKAAYRQMVSQWHPDRLGSTTKEVRQFATNKMAAINAAYRLLRSGLGNKST